MSGEIVGFLSLGLLILINIIMVAVSYGKYSQKIEDLGARVTRLENKIFNGSRIKGE